MGTPGVTNVTHGYPGGDKGNHGYPGGDKSNHGYTPGGDKGNSWVHLYDRHRLLGLKFAIFPPANI